MPYTQTGPFTDGTTPAINQTFLNNVESWLVNTVSDTNITATSGILTVLGLNINTPAVSQNGSSSGTAKLYEIFQGTVKCCMLLWSNYKSAGGQTLTLPVAFSGGFSTWWTTELQGGKLEALSAGTAQTFSVINSISAVGGGSQSARPEMDSHSFGMCRGNFDTVRITVTGATAASGGAMIFGS